MKTKNNTALYDCTFTEFYDMVKDNMTELVADLKMDKKKEFVEELVNTVMTGYRKGFHDGQNNN